MNFSLRRNRLDGPKGSLAILIAGCCLLLTACGAATPADPSLPLTIPAATVQAWHSGPVTGKLQAAINAQAYLGTTRLYFDAPAQIIFIVKMSLPEAQRRVASTDGPMSGIDVWLVIFEGDYQIVPPVSPTPLPSVSPTPIPSMHGCAFVIISAPDGAPVQVGAPTSCS